TTFSTRNISNPSLLRRRRLLRASAAKSRNGASSFATRILPWSRLPARFTHFRHCEEPQRGDEAIQKSNLSFTGLLRFARNDESVVPLRKENAQLCASLPWKSILSPRCFLTVPDRI